MLEIDGKDDKSVQSVSEFEHFYQSMEGSMRQMVVKRRKTGGIIKRHLLTTKWC